MLWIDQICINQPDAVEKSSQLALMGEIYCKAQSVVIWLGAGTEDSNRALQYLRELEPLMPSPQTYMRAREEGTAYQQGYLFTCERPLRKKLEEFHSMCAVKHHLRTTRLTSVRGQSCGSFADIHSFVVVPNMDPPGDRTCSAGYRRLRKTDHGLGRSRLHHGCTSEYKVPPEPRSPG